jgi:hypothetical protein
MSLVRIYSDILLGVAPFDPTTSVLPVDVTHHVVQVLIKTAECLDLDLEDFPGRRTAG